MQKINKSYNVISFFFVFYFLNPYPVHTSEIQITNAGIYSIDFSWLYLKAIQQSYPDIAEDLYFDTEEDDWCIKISGKIVYWANGRLLQKKDKDKWENWQPFISYSYPREIQNPKNYSETILKILKSENFIENRKKEKNPNYTFYNLVYKGKTRKQITKQLKHTSFLGKAVWVHSRIVQPLKKVEQRIIELGKKNKEVNTFIKNLEYCWGFNWREIADSEKLSNHSWGIAVDVVPVNNTAKTIYWFWESRRNKNWMNLPLNKRWAPPQLVIDAFEKEGFVWGGKWELWDNMHFEYRPEMIYICNFFEYLFDNNTVPHIKKQITVKSEDIKTSFEISGILIPIFETLKLLNFSLKIAQDNAYVIHEAKESEYEEIPFME